MLCIKNITEPLKGKYTMNMIMNIKVDCEHACEHIVKLIVNMKMVFEHDHAIENGL